MRGSRWISRAALAACIIMLGAVVLACDPCSGVSGCSVGPYLAADGQIVDPVNGAGVDGVRIDLVRTSGISTSIDSTSVVTRDGGHWHVRFDVASEGVLNVRARVTPPNGVSYDVPNVRLLTSVRGGEGNLVERWVTVPYFRHVAELAFRGAADARVIVVPVEFRRTGGVSLAGPTSANQFRTTTDSGGRIGLFGVRDGVLASGTGEIIGDLYVELPDPYTTAVVRGVRIPTTYVYRDPAQVFRVLIGPTVDYTGEFQGRARRTQLAGVRVDFRRTGGVPTEVDRISTVSGPDGRFKIQLRPLGAGFVDGELVFTAPAPSTPETLKVRLPTFDDDAGRFFPLGVLSAGAYLPYYAILKIGGIGRPGIKVDVHRSGGIGINPADFTVESDQDGIVRIQPSPLALGEAIIDMTFRPPAPYPSFTVKNIRLATADREVQDRNIWVWGMDVPPTGPPGTTIVP